MIKAGDLVMVVRGHCAHVWAGKAVTVSAVMDAGGRTATCLRCGESYSTGMVAELNGKGYRCARNGVRVNVSASGFSKE